MESNTVRVLCCNPCSCFWQSWKAVFRGSCRFCRAFCPSSLCATILAGRLSYLSQRRRLACLGATLALYCAIAAAH
eukprot:6936728-Prymnesium_polylepis.1